MIFEIFYNSALFCFHKRWKYAEIINNNKKCNNYYKTLLKAATANLSLYDEANDLSYRP